MTGSLVLLHCTNAKLRAAREEAWEGRDPGGIRVLLNSPGGRSTCYGSWSCWVLGVVEDDTDVEEACAASLDGWIVWEAEERVVQERTS